MNTKEERNETVKMFVECIVFAPFTKRIGVPEGRKYGKNNVCDYLIEDYVITHTRLITHQDAKLKLQLKGLPEL